jgi:hypothetical protein
MINGDVVLKYGGITLVPGGVIVYIYICCC